MAYEYDHDCPFEAFITNLGKYNEGESSVWIRIKKKRDFPNYGKSLFCAQRKEPPMAEQTPDSIITTRRNGQTIVAELFFNHGSTETFRDKLLKLVLADSSRLSASDGQEPEKTEITR